MSLSLCTGILALGLLVTGPLSDALGRKNIMVISLLSAAIFTFISAFMQSWDGILLVGFALSGVAAVAMTYLSEEIHPNYLVLSMGLYISGNSIGGMSGRLITGILTDHFSWREAPYNFSQTMIGLLAFIFLAGTYSASKAGFLALKYNCNLFNVYWYRDYFFLSNFTYFIGHGDYDGRFFCGSCYCQ